MKIETDYLILGSGIAGLTVAIKLAEQFPDRKILIVTKSNADESNTKYAQGGIAVVIDGIDDDFEKHINDTLICGDGLCNREVVEMVVKKGPKRLKELIDWGTNFDLTAEGNLDLAKEGGHSNHRVVHHKDQTGREIERAILTKTHQKKNIEILDFHFAIDLITKFNSCFGAFVLDEKNDKEINLKIAKVPSQVLTFQLFEQGKTIGEIALERGLVKETVIGHLAKFAEQGLLDISRVITSDKIKAFESVFKNDPKETLTEWKNALPNDFEFNEIRILINHFNYLKEKGKI